MDRSDTIFALASGHGRAAIAVIRVSGPASATVVTSLTARALPPARRAVRRELWHPITREPLDDAIVLWWPGPASFTGEDQAELQVHGGLAVKAAVLAAIATLEECRPAEPGEFTRRAFLNGRLDLTRVEGLADLIDAETEAQRRQAQRLQGGALARLVEAWQDTLTDVLAATEAALDFSDEADVPSDVADAIDGKLAGVTCQVGKVLQQSIRGERIREGYTVVIAGPPNAGKSTLMNAVARRDVAIVSAQPGTTRDAIEVRCDLDGLPVTFVDTAGLRDTSDEVEQQGVARSRAHASSADLVLWLEDGDQEPAGTPLLPVGPPILYVRTKVDLGVAGEGLRPRFLVSARRGDGMSQLLKTIAAALDGGDHSSGDALATRERHRWALQAVAECLDRARLARSEGRLDLVAEDVRVGLRALGSLTGQVDVEAVLDRIFSQFCIGK